MNNNFTVCSNDNCGMIFEFDSLLEGMERFLCPSCRYKLHSFHIVQCNNCQTIFELLPVPADELPVMLNAKVCGNCQPKQNPIVISPNDFSIESYV